jgi:hypothetical protein
VHREKRRQDVAKHIGNLRIAPKVVFHIRMLAPADTFQVLVRSF